MTNNAAYKFSQLTEIVFLPGRIAAPSEANAVQQSEIHAGERTRQIR
jgi:hypothetical protein